MDKLRPIKIYIDEDPMDKDLVAALRSRDITVTTALDCGLIGRPDERHLAFATAHEYVLYTFNAAISIDFTRNGPGPDESMPV